MNRGSSTLCVEMRVFNSHFNEAPIHESGKCVQKFLTMRVRPNFNEAPIHESGKSLYRRSQPRALYHFNEAPIHESGKSGAHDVDAV